jgi:hypothetical protein
MKNKNPLKKYLKKHELSQIEFGRLLEKVSGESPSRSTVCRWLSGERRPDRFWRREIERTTKKEISRGDW